MALFPRLAALLILLLGCSAVMADGVTLFGDVLVWHVSEETSSVWSSTVKTTDSANVFSTNNVEFDWNAGFRIGLAHLFDQDSWDTKVYWTNFGSTQEVLIPPGDQAIVPEFFSSFVGGDAGVFDTAELSWNLTFNNVDFEIGRTLNRGDCIAVRPFMGLKVAVIDQSIRANWANDTLDLTAIEYVDHTFRGLGPRFGIGGRCKVSKQGDLSVVGSFSGALLWGVWNVRDTYERTDVALPLLTYGAFTTSMNDSSLGSLNLDYFLGLEWIHQGEITVVGRIGYELQWWANQQRLPTFQQLPMHGDLTLQGLTCGITVGF
jgi:hypothetical protein